MNASDCLHGTRSNGPSAVIFDVDGTLIDSVDLHAQAWVDAFLDFGHEVAFQSVRRQIGKGGDHLMPVFLSKEEIDRVGSALDEHRGHLFKERYLALVRPFPAVRELFQRLIAGRKSLALASSAKKDELAEYEKIANIADLIDAKTSSDDAESSKPDPDIFHAALGRLHVDPGLALVVGDTPYDAEAAAKARLRTIGLQCGGWTEQALLRAGCVEVYRDPADLLARYEQSALCGEDPAH